jgi:hypothetical protein
LAHWKVPKDQIASTKSQGMDVIQYQVSGFPPQADQKEETQALKPET